VEGISADIYSVVYLPVGEDAQVHTSAIEGLDGPDGVSQQEGWVMGDVIMGGVIPENDAEIIWLLIMVGHVEFPLRKCAASGQHKDKKPGDYFTPV
jgi:hypothetical protein